MVYQICIGLKIIHKSYHMVMDIIWEAGKTLLANNECTKLSQEFIQ
jgi:hypothetical protein